MAELTHGEIDEYESPPGPEYEEADPSSIEDDTTIEQPLRS